MKAFNITFHFGSDDQTTWKGVSFPSCESVRDIRNWLNNHYGFIDAAKQKSPIVNLRKVIAVEVDEAKVGFETEFIK